MENKKNIKLFLDVEFTGLYQCSTPISLALITEENVVFYAEFNDYDEDLVDNWINTNVVKPLLVNQEVGAFEEEIKASLPFEAEEVTYVYGDRNEVVEALKIFLLKYPNIQIIGDVLAYDWVIFCELFGGAMSLPENIYYIPIDLSTELLVCGFDPDIDRSEFAGYKGEGYAHLSYFDASLVKLCYERLHPNFKSSNFHPRAEFNSVVTLTEYNRLNKQGKLALYQLFLERKIGIVEVAGELRFCLSQPKQITKLQIKSLFSPENFYFLEKRFIFEPA